MKNTHAADSLSDETSEVSYCVAKKIGLAGGRGDVDTDMMKRLIRESPKMIDDVTRQKFIELADKCLSWWNCRDDCN